MAPSPSDNPTGFTVVDVETTGRARCPPERIIEIAMVRVDLDGTVRDEFDTLLQPDRPVTATWVHSIPDRLLADAPRFADVAGDLAALLEGSILVGHNADFDIDFLRAEFTLAGLALPALPVLCTLGLTRRLHPNLGSYRLVDCCAQFGIPRGRGHTALDDTRATAALFQRLLQDARARGLTTLEDLGGRPGPPLPAGWGRWPRTGRALRRDHVQPLVPAKPLALLAPSADLPLRVPATVHGRGGGLAGLDEQAQALLVGLTGPGAVLRNDQRTAIRALTLERRRVLVVQRTGWGKSAVYFITTRLLRDAGHGPTLLISPLLALMRDQLAAATRLGIRAATINSTNIGDWQGIERALANGEIDLLLVSPERLANPRFQGEVLPALAQTIGLLVVDEAHCISDWGHDFRPDYRRLIQVLDQLATSVPVLATTATANQRVTTDVAEQLGGQVLTLRGPLDRDSLVLTVLRLPRQAQRLAWLATHLPTLPGSGIVYCLTVDDTKHVADWLTARGISARAYSGRDDTSEREAIEQALHANTLKAVVATSALGMGFDKPDLAFVVHFQAPSSPIAYYQQIGRAGRALDRAEIVLLHGAEDQHIWNYFTTTAFPAEQRLLTVLELLSDADAPLRLNQIEAAVDLSRNRLQHMLKVLEVEGAVRRTPAGWEPTGATWAYDEQRYARVTATRRAEQATMLGYANLDSCLMAYLRRQLDDPQASDCGRCANCTGQRPDPTLDRALVAGAQRFLDRQDVVVEPRQRWPYGVDGLEGPIPAEQRVEPGRALARASAPGWGNTIRELLAGDQALPDQIVGAVVRLLDRWDWPTPPAWVTFVPSRRHPQLVESLARQAAAACGVPLVPVVRRVRDGGRQAELANSTHRCRNVHGAFAIDRPLPGGPVLLVDDAADSRWTLTVVGAALGQAGTTMVLPLVLVHGP